MKNVVFGLFISVLLIAGCATPIRENQSVDSHRHQQRLATLTDWKIRGRLAFKSPEDKVSAYLRWHQQKQEFDLKLTTFIGTTIMTMQGQPGYVQLETDEQIYSDLSASRLIYKVTGWNIPVEKLALWVKGQHTDKDNVIYDDQGLIRSLTAKCRSCAPWTLLYSGYKQVDDVWLPQNIELRNTRDPNNQIKIKISTWQIR
jgi:outer membrane lipoprotein LolB